MEQPLLGAQHGPAAGEDQDEDQDEFERRGRALLQGERTPSAASIANGDFHGGPGTSKGEGRQHGDHGGIGEELAQMAPSDAAAVRAMKLELAAVYLHDAVHARKPSYRIQRVGNSSWITPLQAYRICHGRWRYFYLTVIFIHMSLALFEWPAEWHTEGAFVWTTLVEFCCLFVYLGETWLRAYSHDKANPKMSRLVQAKVIIIALMITELVIICVLRGLGFYYFRLTRTLRPFFLLQKGRNMQRLAQAMFASVPEIIDVVVMIGLHILLFGFIGFLLFSKNAIGVGDNENFVTLEQSFLSLMILLTTANHPDVMMPSYTASNWSAIFFVIFLIFGLYFLMNVILAVVYNTFHLYTQRMAERNLRNQCLALCAAFDVLANNEGRPIEERFIDLQRWKEFSEYVRPKLLFRHSLLIFYALDRDGTGQLSFDDWSYVCEYIDVSISGDRDFKMLRRGQSNVLGSDMLGSAFASLKLRLRRALRTAASERIFDTVVLCNAIFIVWMFDRRARGHDTSDLQFVNKLFLAFFVTEIALKVYAFGFRQYLKDHFNKLDFVVTLVSFVAESIGHLPKVSSITVFRLVRLFRIMRTLKRFRVIFVTLRQVLPAFQGVFGVLMCVYYAFAVAGMELFAGKITRDKKLPELKDTPWVADDYWENNFNRLSNSFVTLWELMVVNNWYIIMEAYATVTTRWARLFFVAFYFVTVVVVLNAIVAFVLEGFLSQYKHATRGRHVPQWERDIRKLANDLTHELSRYRYRGLTVVGEVARSSRAPSSAASAAGATDLDTELRSMLAEEEQQPRSRAHSKAQPFADIEASPLQWTHATLEHRTRQLQRFGIRYRNVHSWRIRRKRRTPQMYRELFRGELQDKLVVSARSAWSETVKSSANQIDVLSVPSVRLLYAARLNYPQLANGVAADVETPWDASIARFAFDSDSDEAGDAGSTLRLGPSYHEDDLDSDSADQCVVDDFANT